MITLSIARNLGKLTRLSVRLLEISIGSAKRRRMENQQIRRDNLIHQSDNARVNLRQSMAYKDVAVE